MEMGYVYSLQDLIVTDFKWVQQELLLWHSATGNLLRHVGDSPYQSSKVLRQIIETQKCLFIEPRKVH